MLHAINHIVLKFLDGGNGPWPHSYQCYDAKCSSYSRNNVFLAHFHFLQTCLCHTEFPVQHKCHFIISVLLKYLTLSIFPSPLHFFHRPVTSLNLLSSHGCCFLTFSRTLIHLNKLIFCVSLFGLHSYLPISVHCRSLLNLPIVFRSLFEHLSPSSLTFITFLFLTSSRPTSNGFLSHLSLLNFLASHILWVSTLFKGY